jgi:hypothetical protein
MLVVQQGDPERTEIPKPNRIKYFLKKEAVWAVMVYKMKQVYDIR